MKEYIVFWTYEANYASSTRRCKALGPMNAIQRTWPGYAQDKLRQDSFLVRNDMRFLVFEVGGDIVHEGVFQGHRIESEIPTGVPDFDSNWSGKAFEWCLAVSDALDKGVTPKLGQGAFESWLEARLVGICHSWGAGAMVDKPYVPKGLITDLAKSSRITESKKVELLGMIDAIKEDIQAP